MKQKRSQKQKEKEPENIQLCKPYISNEIFIIKKVDG